RLAGVELRRPTRLVPPNDRTHRLGRPSLKAALDDGPGRLERAGELLGGPRMGQVILPAGRLALERRQLGTRLAEDVAEPEHANRGGVPEDRPDRPRLAFVIPYREDGQGQILGGQPADALDRSPVIARPV